MVTLQAVAKLAGVSRATASRALTGNPRVSPSALRAVERAAQKLGYVPNAAARTLTTGRTDTVALVIAEPTQMVFGDPFFGRLVRGIGDVIADNEKQLILLMPQSSEAKRLVRYVLEGHVDGALLASLHQGHPLPELLAKRGIPFVIGGRPAHPDRFSYVDVDNVGGARAAVGHLVSMGRRTIATICGPSDMPAGQDRRLGYRLAIEAAGPARDAGLEEPTSFSREGGIAAMRRLLQRRPGLDAVFAASDLQASGALQVLAEAGRRVPEDVAVVGFDDHPFAASMHPQLSSVHQPIEAMGHEMARLLLETMRSPRQPPRRVLLGTELRVRSSSAGSRSRRGR
ncbi:MAG: LacI family DNA-binding transcriptional regulator [Candidatus Dormiibacterota bacterium]